MRLPSSPAMSSHLAGGSSPQKGESLTSSTSSSITIAGALLRHHHRRRDLPLDYRASSPIAMLRSSYHEPLSTLVLDHAARLPCAEM